jgi:mitochondrial intermediate peptidase
MEIKVQVKTLFHELGHALNSVLCDNDLQHLFGARGPLDVVELPSHILERAVLNPTVLHQLATSSLQGRDDCSPKAMKNVEAALLLREKFCESLGRMHSLMMPQADALLHSRTPPSTVEELSSEFADTVASVLPMHVPLGAYPRFSVNHLVAYGGLCHAYTFADEISELVWEHHLGNELQGGAELAQMLYRPGGAVDAPAALRRLLPRDATGCMQQLLHSQ